MNIKILEVRDIATFIPVIAISMVGNTVRAYYLHTRCSYPRENTGRKMIAMLRVDNLEGHNDPYDWPKGTLFEAHKYIQQHFDDLEDGDVVDVQYILGRSSRPKTSERLERGEPAHGT
jgi:hypothetical protein